MLWGEGASTKNATIRVREIETTKVERSASDHAPQRIKRGKALSVMAFAGCLVCALAGGTAYAADASGGGSAPGGGGSAPGGGGGGANSMTYDYSGTLSGALTADGSEQTSKDASVEATTADQNAALVENGGTLTIANDTLTKSGDDTDGDNCNFYGLNSILLAVGNTAKAFIEGSTLNASSEGSNGIFATNGATVYANNDTISTTAGNSRGLDATYDGTIVAAALNIVTQGAHCAGIATDRGGGNISAVDSVIATEGSGSPVLYSTGDIEISGVTGTASGSQIAGMEGLNTILIHDSNLTSTITAATASDPVADAVIIYQSTSGDAESTTGAAATFDAVDSTLNSSIQSGSFFYLTNTTANVVVKDTLLNYDASKASLILAEGNSSNNWGSAGANGATVNFTADTETMEGNVSCDAISSLDLFLLNNSKWTGAATVAAGGNLTMNVDATSTWVVTDNSTVTNLNAASGAKIVDASGKTASIVAGGSTVVQGDSSVTVTVSGAYSTTVTTSSVNEVTAAKVDRSGYDSHYGTQTSFDMNATTATAAASSSKSTATTAASSASSSSATTDAKPWYQGIADWFSGLFGGK